MSEGHASGRGDAGYLSAYQLVELVFRKALALLGRDGLPVLADVDQLDRARLLQPLDKAVRGLGRGSVLGEVLDGDFEVADVYGVLDKVEDSKQHRVVRGVRADEVGRFSCVGDDGVGDVAHGAS